MPFVPGRHIGRSRGRPDSRRRSPSRRSRPCICRCRAQRTTYSPGCSNHPKFLWTALTNSKRSVLLLRAQLVAPCPRDLAIATAVTAPGSLAPSLPPHFPAPQTAHPIRSDLDREGHGAFCSIIMETFAWWRVARTAQHLPPCLITIATTGGRLRGRFRRNNPWPVCPCFNSGLDR